MRRIDCIKPGLVLAIASGLITSGATGLTAAQESTQPAAAQQTTSPLPSYPLKFGAFVVRFDPGGTFTLKGQGWPALSGNWKSTGAEVELSMSGGPGGCDAPGRISFA